MFRKGGGGGGYLDLFCGQGQFKDGFPQQSDLCGLRWGGGGDPPHSRSEELNNTV